MKKIFLLFSFVFVSIFIVSDVFARAGGGGWSHSSSYHSSYHSSRCRSSSSSCSSFWDFFSTLIVLASVGSVSAMVRVKTKKAAQQLRGLQSQPNWNKAKLEKYIWQVFNRVQYAWEQRDFPSAQPYLSENYSKTFKRQIDDMITTGVINKLDNMLLEKIEFFSIHDEDGYQNDFFTVKVSAKTFDYKINAKTGENITQKQPAPERFEELWTFIFENNTWKLDEIDSKIDLGDALS